MPVTYPNNPWLTGNQQVAQPQAAPAPSPSSSIGTNVSGFTPENGPSAVFSGAMPAVDFKANPYLLNQLQQFRQMQTPSQGTQDAFSRRMQGMGGQAQSLFNPVQDASLGKGLLGADFQLGTELPGYTPDHKVGYTDVYGGKEQKVGSDPLAGGDYAGAKDASGNVPTANPYNYYTATGQNTINMSKLMDANNKPLTNVNGYQMWNGDNGTAYAGVGNIPIAVNPRTGKLNFAGKENLQINAGGYGLLNVDLQGQDRNTGYIKMKDSTKGLLYYDPATGNIMTKKGKNYTNVGTYGG